MKNTIAIGLMLIVPFMTGCASMLGIGEAEFSCGIPDRTGFKCRSARDVYELTHPNTRNHQDREGTGMNTPAPELERKSWFKRLTGKFRKSDPEANEHRMSNQAGATGATVVEKDMAVIRSDPTYLHQNEVAHIDYGVRRYSQIHDKRYYGSDQEMFEVIPTTTTSMIPIRTPPKVMRVMIASYESKEGVLHSGGYSFVEIESRKWQIGTPAESRGDGRVRSMERVLNENAETIAKPASTGVNVGPVNIEAAQQRFTPNTIPGNNGERGDPDQQRIRLTPEELEQQQLQYYLQQQQEQQEQQ